MSQNAQFVKLAGLAALLVGMAVAGCENSQVTVANVEEKPLENDGETSSAASSTDAASTQKPGVPDAGAQQGDDSLPPDDSGANQHGSDDSGTGDVQSGDQSSSQTAGQGNHAGQDQTAGQDNAADQGSGTQDAGTQDTASHDAGAQDVTGQDATDQDHGPGRAEIDWDAPVKQPPEAEGMKATFPDAEVWFDLENKKIVMAGRICQNTGPLEFFATLRGYQEHEAIATIKTKSSYIHGLLLAIGLEPGHPVQYRPEFKPAAGPEIDVTVFWTDENGERKSAKAQEWVKNFETGKPLDQPFVFGGSTIFKMEDGSEYYAADDGYLICVSNFPSAMLDLPISSPEANAALLYEAFEEKMPPIGTEIAIVLQPKQVEEDKSGDDQNADKAADGDGGAAAGDGGQ